MAHGTTFPRAVHLHQRRNRAGPTAEVLDRHWFGRRLMTIGGYTLAWLAVLTGGITLFGHAAGLL